MSLIQKLENAIAKTYLTTLDKSSVPKNLAGLMAMIVVLIIGYSALGVFFYIVGKAWWFVFDLIEEVGRNMKAINKI